VRVVIYVKEEPGPFQVVFVAVALLGGLVLLAQVLFGGGGTISQTQPNWALLTLSISLIVGGAVTLIGVILQTAAGPFLERSGLALLTFMLTAYAILILDVSGTRGLTTVVFFGGYAVAAVWRIIQVNRVIRRVHTVVDAQTTAEEGELPR
jgi:hypothetical protein